MHILFLTDNFPPEGNAPASRTFEHAKEWVKAGHKVTVITGVPNFPEGKVYEGYQNKWFQQEEIEEIEVRRVKTYITANEGFLKRTLDFVSFMFSSFFASFAVKKVDVIVGTSPQFFTVISAYTVALFKRIPFVFELRDIWPASITAVGAMKKNIVITMLERIEMFLYKKAAKIISVTHSFKKELIERGVAGDKIEVVLNGVDLSTFQAEPNNREKYKAKYGLQGKFVVGYVGTHGMAHALDSVLDAAKKLKEIEPNIVFLLAGGGAAKPALDERIKSEKISNVISLSRQPKVDMPKIWNACDVALVSLKDTPLFKTVIPSKIFEAMGVGLPILITAPQGEATQIIERATAGIVVKPESPEGLRNSILKLHSEKMLYQKYRQQSQEHAQQFDRKNQAKKMLVALEQLIK